MVIIKLLVSKPKSLIPNVEAFEGDYIVATGTSCRHQIHDLAQRTAVHLLDVLWDQLKMDATAHH